MFTPMALNRASNCCLVKPLMFDVSVVADYARCIRMLLTASARHRRRGLLATCWQALDLERLLHSLVALTMEAWCATQWHPGARSPLQHHAPDLDHTALGSHGDDEVPVVHGVLCEDSNDI